MRLRWISKTRPTLQVSASMKKIIVVSCILGLPFLLMDSESLGRGRGGGRGGGGFAGGARPIGGGARPAVGGGAIHSYGGGAGVGAQAVAPVVGPRGGT